MERLIKINSLRDLKVGMIIKDLIKVADSEYGRVVNITDNYAVVDWDFSLEDVKRGDYKYGACEEDIGDLEDCRIVSDGKINWRDRMKRL